MPGIKGPESHAQHPTTVALFPLPLRHLTLLAEAPIPGSASVAGSARDVAVGSVKLERAQKADMDNEMDMQEETEGTEKGGRNVTPPPNPTRLEPPAQKTLRRTPQKSPRKSPHKAPPQKSPVKTPQKGKGPRVLVCLDMMGRGEWRLLTAHCELGRA